MRAQTLTVLGPVEDRRLALIDRPVPTPGPDEILIRVSACGVCHTELDEIEGRLPPRLPIVPGHQIVGIVDTLGPGTTSLAPGDRVGVTWINWACGRCAACRAGNENLCPNARWTGKDVDGGYADYVVAPAAFVQRIPPGCSDVQAAPLLCAGVIGYRALRRAQVENGHGLGLYGFGASAHLVIQVARHLFPDCRISVFTRGQAHRELAQRLGADWTGRAGETPPWAVDRAIDFTPVGATVRDALAVLAPGGRLVVNAIRKRDPVPELDYAAHLWQEKELTSTANVTRRDAEEFLTLAAAIPIVSEVRSFGLEEANEALILQKQGKIGAAAVLTMT